MFPSGKAGKGGKPFKSSKFTEAELRTPDNPGLLDGAPVYEGAIKLPVDHSSGFGFVQSDKVMQQYGKDAFLHVKNCPWIREMELQTGENVMFNLADEPKDEPQISHIIFLAM